MTADELAIRYYRWALDDARREVAEDFPLLRGVKSGLVMRAVAYLESLPAADRVRPPRRWSSATTPRG